MPLTTCMNDDLRVTFFGMDASLRFQEAYLFPLEFASIFYFNIYWQYMYMCRNLGALSEKL